MSFAKSLADNLTKEAASKRQQRENKIQAAVSGGFFDNNTDVQGFNRISNNQNRKDAKVMAGARMEDEVATAINRNKGNLENGNLGFKINNKASNSNPSSSFGAGFDFKAYRESQTAPKQSTAIVPHQGAPVQSTTAATPKGDNFIKRTDRQTMYGANKVIEKANFVDMPNSKPGSQVVPFKRQPSQAAESIKFTGSNNLPSSGQVFHMNDTQPKQLGQGNFRTNSSVRHALPSSSQPSGQVFNMPAGQPKLLTEGVKDTPKTRIQSTGVNTLPSSGNTFIMGPSSSPVPKVTPAATASWKMRTGVGVAGGVAGAAIGGMVGGEDNRGTGAFIGGAVGGGLGAIGGGTQTAMSGLEKAKGFLKRIRVQA